MDSGPDPPDPSRTEPTHDVAFADAARFWVKLGFINFGGPTGQIAIMHEELVDRRRWISEHRFLHALNYCMLLPGPEAQQLAIYVGWLLHKVRGGLVAGIAFILPGVLPDARPVVDLRGPRRHPGGRRGILRAPGGGGRHRRRRAHPDRGRALRDGILVAHRGGGVRRDLPRRTCPSR